VSSFLLNIIPFAGPSNLFIAYNASIVAVDVDPFTIGVAVAFASASAKFIHYLITFFAGKYIGEQLRKKLDAESAKLKKWAMLTLFAVAATPLPDEPVIIPLGLLRYNPGKLFTAYFAGKLIIGVVGAFLGKLGYAMFKPWISNEVLMVISIIVTIVVTVVLLKVDVTKLAEKIFKREIKLMPE
jgi:membrane protein YqaA with SNARE-associated domain